MSAAAAALGVVPATAAPHDTRAEVDRLYTEAEKATEAYNKADERAGTLRRQVTDAQDRIARQQLRINTMRDRLGSLAGAQYRAGGLDPSLALLFSDDPDDYLDKATALDRITAHQAGELRELQDAMRDLAQERAEATRRLGELERSRRAVATHKRTVERKLARPAGSWTACRRPSARPTTGPPARRATGWPSPAARCPSPAGRPPRWPPPAPPSAGPTSGAPTGPPASTARA